MKKFLIILFIIFSQSIVAQIPTVAKITPKDIKLRQYTNVNMLKVDPKYVKPARAFIPWEVPKEELSKPEYKKSGYKGMKLDSVYTWTKPDGKQARATGQQILDEVNKMEKSLCEVGHSLRDRQPFYNIRTVKNVPTNYTILPGGYNNSGRSPDISVAANLPKPNHTQIPTNAGTEIVDKYIFEDVFFATGRAALQEFDGAMNSMFTQSISNRKLNIPICIAMKPESWNKVKKIIFYLVKNPNDEVMNSYMISAMMEKNSLQKTWKYAPLVAGTRGVRVGPGVTVPPANSNYMVSLYFVDLLQSKKIPAASFKDDLYYVKAVFYNDKGDIMYYNILSPLYVNNSTKEDVSFTNVKSYNSGPIKYVKSGGVFGFAIESSGLSAKSSYKKNNADNTHEREISVAGQMDLRFQYFNFAHLLSESEPEMNELSLLSYNVFASDTYKGNGPIIKTSPTDIRTFSNLQGTYSICGGIKTGDLKAIENYSDNYTIFNERFNIGPVPCRVAVNMSWGAELNLSGTYLNAGRILQTHTEPHAWVSIHGEGGVDAVLAYAMIEADVNIVDVKIPMDLYAEADKEAKASAMLNVNGFGGAVYFQAGICTPDFPFFGQHCWDFTINIIDWKGFPYKESLKSN